MVLAFTSVFVGMGCSNQPQSFTVTFLSGAEDAELLSGKTVQTVTSHTQLEPPVFARSGYNFDGWSYVLSEINKDTVVRAMWTRYEFWVTFNANGGANDNGESTIVVKVKSGLDIAKVAPKFKKKGYSLSWDTEFGPIQNSCVINAVWTPNQYKVSFLDNDETSLGLEDLTVSYDDKLTGLPVLQNKVVDGKTKRFSHWENTKGNSFVEGMFWEQEHDETLYPVWIDGEFIIKYNLNGGYLLNNLTSYNSGDEISISNPTRKGHSFIGWTSDDITQPVQNLKIGCTDRGDKFFTANWQAETYTFTLDYNGGTASGSDKANVTFGEKVGELNTPQRDNYEFIGWKFENDSRLINKETVWDIDASDVQRVLIAQYKKIYTIKFSLTAKVFDKYLNCVITDWADFNANGKNLEEITLTIKEGQTLKDIGINKLPTVDPIEPSTGKPNGKGDDYYYLGYWKYTYYMQFANFVQEYFVVINQDTLFIPSNFKNIGEDGVVLLTPSCLSDYTS